jgi:thiol-disulfide isomerase/thioredoxin
MTITTLLLVLVAATPSGSAADVTLLDFTAEWCGPCRQMKPVVQRLAESGVPVKAVDLDRSPTLARKYHVQSIPTFVLVDSNGNEIDRVVGAVPASELERSYRNAREKVARVLADNSTRRPSPNRESDDAGDDEGVAEEADDPDGGDDGQADEAPATRRYQNPKAWETVARIRVIGQGSIGFGSGTIISSTPEESLILTCAHVFKLDGRRQQPPASQFPRKIMIDLFDGKLQGVKPAHVNFTESVEGTAVDYDFTLDVGLIRIRPGRRLPFARVVPAHWTPAERMHMLTVGCSEGHDASVWATKILKPKMKGLSGNPNYEAIECAIAPIQGRSGGGLFTDDGYVAGVCNFAETHGNVGLYATPASIYKILDRNNLMALYAPVSNGNTRLVADRGDEPRRVRPGTRRRASVRDDDAPLIARGQSPERDDEAREVADADPDTVLIPPPHFLGIEDPGSRQSRSRHSAQKVTSRESGSRTWERRSPSTPKSRSNPVATETTIDPSVEISPFESFNGGHDTDDRGPRKRSESRKPVAKPKADSGDQLIWRPVMMVKP